MTIDERIEALTHSVELLQHSMADINRAHAALEKTVNKFGRFVMVNTLDHEKRITKLEILRDDEGPR